MNEQSQRATDNRRHFLVDINTVLSLFGKRYFLIFYFGKHLHPRQREQLVNQRTMGNWLAIGFVLLLLAGFAFGVWGMIMWRLGQNTALPASAGSFTELSTTHAPRV
ncbi:MAG TPA: hypothetical protein VIN57_05280 [Magnetovibrio sp.]